MMAMELVSCLVSDKLVRAAEVVAPCDKGLGSNGTEVHIVDADIVVYSGDVIRGIVRDLGNGDDGLLVVYGSYIMTVALKSELLCMLIAVLEVTRTFLFT
jgi:hypothetical protein